MSQDSKDFVLACCGLVCSQCGAYLKNKCRGCHSEKPMNTGCKVKPCVQEKGYTTCAECADFGDLKACKKLNNFISKIFALIFRSDRIGNLNHIREIGIENSKKKSKRELT